MSNQTNTNISVDVSPQHGVSIFIPNWGIVFLLLLLVEVVGIVLQKLLFGSPENKRQLAGLAATAVENAQILMPALRTTQLDDYLAKVLRAYAQMDEKIKENINSDNLSPVLDVLKQNPEFLAQLIGARPSQAATMVMRAARIANESTSKHGAERTDLAAGN